MAIVGLADKSVADSKERVRAALSSLGLALPSKRIAINLSPADVLKEGAHFDLPIAVALLVAMCVLPEDSVQDCLILGELSLSGSVKPVSGVLSAALAASASDRWLICPAACGGEAAWAGTIDVIAPNDLTSLLSHLRGAQILSPPGGGKSMLAARLPGLLPALDAREALEVKMLHSVAGQLSAGGLIQQRPFREPHNSASMAALVGGGARAKPVEISLAHNRVLLLDEFAEFSKPVLDALRQPLKTRQVVVARANHHVTYPARFQLVAAMNPCRCGYMGDPTRACSRAPQCGRNCSVRISGPMMDRFDIIIEVPEVSGQLLFSTKPAEASSTIAARIAKAADFAKSHDGLMDDMGENDPSDMTLDFGKCLSADTAELLRLAVEKRQLSARGFYMVIRVGRTIANLGQLKQVGREEVAEALAYRMIPLLA